MAEELALPMHSPPADGQVVVPTDTNEYIPPEIDAPLGDSAGNDSVAENSPIDSATTAPAQNSGKPPSEFDIITGDTPASRLHDFCTHRRELGAAAGVVFVCVVAVVLLLVGVGSSKSDGAGAIFFPTAPLQHRQDATHVIEEFHAEDKAVDTTSFASLAGSNEFELAMAALGSKLYADGRVGSGGNTLAKYHRGLNNNHHLHCDATSSSEPLQPKTVALPVSQLESIADLPSEKDWSGEMNPAKNQESCGSCWAFATNALVEFAIGAKNHGVVNPAELLDRSEHMDEFADSDDEFCKVGADAVGRKCGGTGGCEGLTTVAGLSMLKCGPGSVHLWPDKRAEEQMYDEYYHCLQNDNSCSYANDGECDDGSRGGTQYCAVGTDTNDCTAIAVKGSDTCRYAFDHECDDGSQGGVQYCDAGTDATDCAETQAPVATETKCDFQRAVRKLTEPLVSVSLDKFDIVEVDAFVDQAGEPCDMNRDASECYPNVRGMMEALQHGPIAVGVDASPLQHYRPSGSPTRSRTAYVVSADAAKCGTMCGSDETCLEECSIVAGKALTAQQTPTVDHAVVVVGYGTDELGGAYWKIRNSWSDSYGESGYVRVERATTEVSCGVDTRLQDGNGCKMDENGDAIAAECSARYCGAMGVISPGLVQFLPSSGAQFQR